MERKKRLRLALGSILTVQVIFIFLQVIMMSYSNEIRNTLFFPLLFMNAVSCVAIFFFAMIGDIFEQDGSFKRGPITAIIIAILCILQLTLFFSVYSYKQLEFNSQSLEKATECYYEIREDYKNDELLLSELKLPEEISKIYISDTNDTVLYSTKSEDIGKTAVLNPLDSFRFILDEKTVVVDISKEYKANMIFNILIDLLTVMVASIILSIELVILVIKLLDDKYKPKIKAETEETPRMVGYVRSISFLFYFASRMGAPFIMLIAKKLGGDLFGLPENVTAGLPQSAEFFLTCVAIFFTSLLIEKFGWKLPFSGGVIIVGLGTVLSAFAPNIFVFILSRAIVGLGYGFSWMTLRNFALFAKKDEEKSICFALLNSGIYAGINCGTVIGGILADIIGYVPTLILSAVLTCVSLLFITTFKNAKYVKKEETVSAEKETIKLKKTDLFYVVVFIVLMIIPSCITGSYLGYYVPVYLTDIGRGVSDVGRLQLIYGLIIVYIGPYLIKFIAKQNKPLKWNLLYNTIFASALIVFGLLGGIVPAVFAALMIGLADSFGFVLQNNHFLNLKIVKRLGSSKSLSYISIIRKISEMLGPIIFGVLFMVDGTYGVFILGAVMLVAVGMFFVLHKTYTASVSK